MMPLKYQDQSYSTVIIKVQIYFNEKKVKLDRNTFPDRVASVALRSDYIT